MSPDEQCESREQMLDHNGWSVSVGFWAAQGLSARHKDGRKLQVALETPLATWFARCATIVPRDLVVYSLGPQIVVLDLAQRKIAFLAMGHALRVALDAPPSE